VRRVVWFVNILNVHNVPGRKYDVRSRQARIHDFNFGGGEWRAEGPRAGVGFIVWDLGSAVGSLSGVRDSAPALQIVYIILLALMMS